jgi:hypothetical protein
VLTRSVYGPGRRDELKPHIDATDLKLLETRDAPRQRPAYNPIEAAVRVCLNCGRQLEERKCKLFCECGYYASCSDFY